MTFKHTEDRLGSMWFSHDLFAQFSNKLCGYWNSHLIYGLDATN